MRKITKVTTLGLAMTMSLATLLSATACRSTEELIKDGKTVNVRLYSAGYGTAFIEPLKEKFEKAFEAEGYKLNLFTPKAGLTGEVCLQDISTTGADLYISTGVSPSLLEKDAYKDVVADITTLIADKKPIGFDGQETGDKKISEILADNVYGYNAYQKADGSYYSVPWTASTRGLAVNKKVLSDLDLEIPKTSNEFFHCFDVIMEEAKNTQGDVFPLTQISGNNNYHISFTSGWMAQYEGYEWYQKFCTFENTDGTKMSKTDVLELFSADGIEIMLQNMFHALDPNCSTYGSKNKAQMTAQKELIDGDCAFMMNGDFMFSEMEDTYKEESEKLKNITFVQVPIISALGVKVFGAGTAYNKSDEVCDKILRAIVDEVDANKSLEQIKETVDAEFSTDFAMADIERIATARGYSYTESVESGIYINAKSDVKEIAALFVRMCCSDEGGRLISSYTNSGNPFASGYAESEYDWVNSARNIINNRYFKGVRPQISGYRLSIDTNFLGIFPYTGTYVNEKITKENVTMYDAQTLTKLASTTEQVYVEAGKKMKNNIYNDVKTNSSYVWAD